MKIQLAVYTAVEGYAWQPCEAYSISVLNKYKSIIGSFPDLSVGTLPLGGIFLCENNVVFYRYHIAQKSDSKGRDALYVVLGACPREQVREIDFKALFLMEEFAKPLSPYPKEVDYQGGSAKASEVDYNESFNVTYSTKEDLSILGDVFANYRGDDLVVKLNGSYLNPSFSLKYTKPIVKIPDPVQPNLPVANNPIRSSSIVSPSPYNTRTSPTYSSPRWNDENSEVKNKVTEGLCSYEMKIGISFLMILVLITLLFWLIIRLVIPSAPPKSDKSQMNTHQVDNLPQEYCSEQQIDANTSKTGDDKPMAEKGNNMTINKDANETNVTPKSVCDVEQEQANKTNAQNNAKSKTKAAEKNEASKIKKCVNKNCKNGFIKDKKSCDKCNESGAVEIDCPNRRKKNFEFKRGLHCEICMRCWGDGMVIVQDNLLKCRNCSGDGRRKCQDCKGYGVIKVRCDACDGNGFREGTKECSSCNGESASKPAPCQTNGNEAKVIKVSVEATSIQISQPNR